MINIRTNLLRFRRRYAATSAKRSSGRLHSEFTSVSEEELDGGDSDPVDPWHLRQPPHFQPRKEVAKVLDEEVGLVRPVEDGNEGVHDQECQPWRLTDSETELTPR